MPAFKVPFRRQHTGDRVVDEVQRVGQITAQRVGALPAFANGKLISVHFAVGGTFQIVTHGLGVQASCFPVSLNYDTGALGPTFAEDRVAAGVDQLNQSRLVASAVCTVDMWFYPRSSVRIPSGTTQSPP